MWQCYMFSIHGLNRRPAILDTAAAVAGDAQQVVVRARRSVHHAPLDAPSGLRRPVCSRVTKRVPDFKNCGYGRNVTLLQRNAIDYWS
jgi:hypothetical protein